MTFAGTVVLGQTTFCMMPYLTFERNASFFSKILYIQNMRVYRLPEAKWEDKGEQQQGQKYPQHDLDVKQSTLSEFLV